MLFLNTNIKNKNKAIETAKAGIYIYIFISPEFVSILSFYSLLKDFSFKKRLTLVIINKAHLIVHWGKKFRPEYIKLQYIHNLIGNTIL